jgi:SAM-dependent methyltransferase
MATESDLRGAQLSFAEATKRRVLNAGSGPDLPGRVHPIFSVENWDQVRLDADAAARPDLLGSIANMRGLIPDASFDAVWSSHSLEHLFAHEVLPALKEFRRILKDDGFALITTPDLEAVAKLVVEGRIDDTAYVSPAGPITALDMMFGHSAAIALGRGFMAHNTGFTTDRLGRLILESGFPEAYITTISTFDLWALAVMPKTDHLPLIQKFRTLGVNFVE